MALKGYATKSEEERTKIIEAAGLMNTEQDKIISNFLGLDTPIFGTFIRGIITICIDINNENRNLEFNKHIEEYKHMNNELLHNKQQEMNAIIE